MSAVKPVWCFLDKPVLVLSLKISLSAVLAFLLTCALHIDTPFWAAVSAFAVSGVEYHALFKKCWMRAGGVIIGCYLSYLIMSHFIGYALPFTVASFFIIAFSFYLSQQSKIGYFWAYALLHIVIIGMVIVTDQSIHFSLAFNRAASVSLGVFTSFVVMIAFLPLPKVKQKNNAVKFPAKGISLKYALNNAIAVIVAIWLWQLLQIPGGGINMVVAIITVMQLDTTMTYQKGGQRLMGCLIGVFAGLIFIASVNNVFLAMLILFLVGTVCMYVYHRNMRYYYVGLQASIAFCVTAFPGLAPAATIAPGIERAVGILFGVLVALLVRGTLHSIGRYIVAGSINIL